MNTAIDLNNKVALVTGSTRSIGARTAQVFSANGAKVVVTGRNERLGKQVVSQITDAGGEAEFFSGGYGQRAGR
jgi:NAD(P)-dependent dehydrogenase (short-subunit alcohol dehydrogenase family)